MPTALLTFLGGMRDKAATNKPIYQSADYLFPTGEIQRTDFFAAALKRQQVFEQILIFGTGTSIWEKLAEDAGKLDLALELLAQTDETKGGNGICPENLNKLEQALCSDWKTEVILFAGVPSITSKNVETELMHYVEVLQRIRSEEILLDFTHGFRSMPMLLNSALDFWQSMSPIRIPIRLVYGEYNNRNKSPVHYLDGIQQSMKVAQSVRLFFEKLDGSELADQVGDFWPSGKQTLNRFTVRLQENRLNQIETPLRELSGALKHMSHPEAAPPWFHPIRKRLETWTSNLLQATLPLTLEKLAQELTTNRLHAQAIMALDEALLEAILIARKQPSRELTVDERNGIFKEALRGLDRDLNTSLWRLHNLRNFVAHGARQDLKQGGRPQGSVAAQLPRFFTLIHPILEHPNQYFG